MSKQIETKDCNVESCGCKGFISPRTTPLSDKYKVPNWVIDTYWPEYKGYIVHFTDRCDNCHDKEPKLTEFIIEHESGDEKIHYCDTCVKTLNRTKWSSNQYNLMEERTKRNMERNKNDYIFLEK